MMLNKKALEAATRAIKEAFNRYYVEGTSDDDLHSPPYRAPWHLIDTSTAEPEVNWPGELIQEYDNPQAAYDHRERLAAQAAIKAYHAALPDEGELVAEARKEARTLDGDGFESSADIIERLADALEVARAKSSVPEGWWLAPYDPTREMVEAACGAHPSNPQAPKQVRACYEQMRDAAPESPK